MVYKVYNITTSWNQHSFDFRHTQSNEDEVQEKNDFRA